MNVTVWVIGIGSGSPDHLTGEAVAALNAVEVFLVADKGPAARDLARIRTELCETVIAGDYRVVEVEDPPRDRSVDHTPQTYDRAVRDWHAARARRHREAIAAALPNGGDVGFLVWGDPAFYDSTIRIAESLAGAEIAVDLRVIPGVSSLQLLAAAHRIVLNRIGHSIHVTTGRRLIEDFRAVDSDVVVFLDGALTCAELASSEPDTVIFWGAQLGLPDQALVHGRLADVITEIATARARIRERRGWVMDLYLLRRAD